MVRVLQSEGSRWKSPEFLLVVILLLFMSIILVPIIFAPFPLQGDSANVTADTVLNFRRDVFTAVVTVFAAWIGAGAAYFFGRENLKEAITAIKGESPRELLERKKLREVMKPLETTVTGKDTIETVQKKVLTDTKKWFITVLDEQGRLSNVIDEEAIEKYLADNMKEEQKAAKDVYAKFMKTPIEEVVKYIDEKSKTVEKLGRLINIHVPMSMEQNCIDALERMEKEEKYLTFIVDSKGVPRGYLTTADLRKVLVKT